MANLETVLVTGGTGFVGLQCVLQLLQQGYPVKTTLRSLESRDQVLKTLANSGLTSFDRLTFVVADLLHDANWMEAVRDCRYVLHVASPVFFGPPENESEQIKPAIEGTLRVLKAARDGGVQRVVLTSSFGALGFSHTDTRTETTEADWTDPQLKGLSPYEKSKGLAERAAWDFIKKEGGSLELSVINPVAILGPSLGPHVSGSFDLLKHLLDGSMKAVPNIPLNVVDVRDVADLHIRAMTTPTAKGQRFIATADGQISLPEIAQLLRREFPNVSARVSTKTMPNWMVRVAALFNWQARSGAMLLKVNRRVSNAKARRVLGWQPITTTTQAIAASVASIERYGLVK